MRRIRILEAAAQEAVEAAAWYERERAGLGLEFQQSLQAAFDVLQGDLLPLSPARGALGDQGVKRLVLHRFPYDIVVQERNEEILVLAVAHQARRPGYWRGRSRT